MRSLLSASRYRNPAKGISRLPRYAMIAVTALLGTFARGQDGPADEHLDVTPRSLRFTLRSGEKVTEQLTLENPSSQPMDWNLSVRGSDGYSSSLEGSLSALQDRHAALLDALPPGAIQFGGGVTGSSINESPLQEANKLSTNLSSELPYSDGVIRESSAFGTGGRYFTLKLPKLFLLGADSNGPTHFDISGNTKYSSTPDFLVFPLSRGGRDWLGLATRHTTAFSHSVDHIILIDDPGAFQVGDFTTRLIFSGKRRLYYAMFVTPPNTTRMDTNYHALAQTLLYTLPDHLFGPTGAPATGTLSGAATSTSTLTIDTSGWPTGNYLYLLDPQPGTSDAESRRIPINVEVMEPAVKLDSDFIRRGSVVGGPVESHFLGTASTTGSPVTWSANIPGNPPWVTLSRSTGNSPEAIELKFDPTKVPGTTGVLRAELVVTTPRATQSIPISYTVDPVAIRHLIADPLRSLVYAANKGYFNGAFIVVDPATAKPIRVIPTGLGSCDIDISPDGSRAYVMNEVASTITGINLDTWEVLGTIAAPRNFSGNVFSSVRRVAAGTGSRVYCTDSASLPNLHLLDFDHGSVINSFSASALPRDVRTTGFGDIHFDASEKRLYFTRRSSNSSGPRRISALDTTDDSLTLAGEYPTTATGGYPSVHSRLFADLDRNWFFHGQDSFTRPLGASPTQLLSESAYLESISAYGDLIVSSVGIFHGRNGMKLASLPTADGYWFSAFTNDQSALLLAGATAPYFRRFELPANIRPPAIGIRPSPADGGAVGENATSLSWSSLPYVDGYRVYLGTDRDVIASATAGDPSDRGIFTRNVLPLDPPLPPGSYFWRIDAIRGGTVIPGTVTSFGVASFRINPASVAVAAPVGSLTQEVSLQATNQAGQPVAWTASTTTPWISLTQTSGAAGTPVKLRVNPAGLAAGIRQGSVRVTGLGLALEIPVSLELISVNLTRLKADPSRSIVYGLDTGVLRGKPGHIVAIDAATGSYLRSLPLDDYSTDFAVHPLEDRLYVPTAFSNKIKVIDLTTWTELPTITLAGWTQTGFVYPGRAGRLVLENNNFGPQPYHIDTVNGTALGVIPTGNSYSSTPLAVTTPDGTRLFRTGPSRIQPVDISTDPSLALASVSVPTEPAVAYKKMARSHDGSRTSIDNIVLGPQFELIGFRPAPIDAMTRDGRLSVHPGGMFWTDTGLTFATYPSGYTTTCITSDDRYVVAWSETLAKPVSITIGNTAAPSPLPGATLPTSPAELSWPAVAGATAYYVYLGDSQSAVTSATSNSPLRIATVVGTGNPLSSDLPFGYRYYWRIDAITPTGTLKGAVYYFDVSFPEAFTPLQASAGSILGSSFAASPTGEIATASSQRISIYEPIPSGGFGHRETLIAQDIDNSQSNFGTTLAFGPGVLATGDNKYSTAANDDSGRVHVFSQSPADGWQPEKPLLPASPTPNIGFGSSVAFASNQLLVGEGWAGRNRVMSYFQWPSWQPGPPLVPTPNEDGSKFGHAMAISGTRAIIGAPGEGFSIRGSAFIFEYDAASKRWIQRSRLLPPAGTNGDSAGGSVTISGDLAAIGMGSRNSIFNTARKVQVFQRSSGGSWSQITSITDPQPGAGNFDVYSRFGESVLLQGNLLFILDSYAKHGGRPGGVVYVYRRNGSNWIAAPPIVPPNPDSVFGSEMILQNGMLLVLGSKGENFNAPQVIHGFNIEATRNLPPSFVSEPPTQIVAGRPVDFEVIVTDDGDVTSLTFGQANLPPGLSLVPTGEGTASIQGTPTAAAGTEHWLRIPVTDQSGAQSIQTALVRILAASEAPVLAPLPEALEVRSGEDLHIQPLVTGTAPFTWKWQKDGEDLPGKDRAALVVSEMNGTHAGLYRVIVTNAVGSTTSTEVRVTVRAADRMAGDWTGYGSGPNHDGYQSATLGNHRFVPLWTYSLGVRSGLGQVFTSGGSAYFLQASMPGTLRSHSLADGAEVWSRPLGWLSYAGTPSLWDGKLFANYTDDNSATNLWAIGRDGATLWQQPSYGSGYGLHGTVVDDTGVFVSSGYGLQGFEANGSPRFAIRPNSAQSFLPALSHGRLFTWTSGTFSERDPADGAVIWAIPGPASQGSAPLQVPVIQGDKACVLDSYAYLLRCFDIRLRKEIWSVSYGLQGAPAISGNRVFILHGADVRELSLEDGSLIATHKTDAPSNNNLAGQPLLLNDHLIVTNASKTWIINREAGETVQTLPYGGVASYSGNKLLLGGSEGHLRAFLANVAPQFSDTAPADIAAGDAATAQVIALAGHVTDEDAGDTMSWAIESVSNPGLFRSIEINATSGDLSVEYNPWTSGESEVVITATDTAGNVARQTIRFTLPVLPEPELQLAATLTLNRQTGLYEHRITVTNTAAREIAGFDLAITGLPAGVTANNASSSEGGIWTIHHRQPLAAGASTVILVEYYTPVRGTVVQPQASVAIVAEPESDPAAGAPGLAVDRCVKMADDSLLIEFTSTPGTQYEVQYSDDMRNWKVSPVKVRAAGNRVQWIDRGPPRTDSPPAENNSRYYRVRELPAS
ncbi:PQQ-binding-like beta-propeller repeat protein [Luteolibacter flavescens]|uniref:PQQ-binding-like beta-propeller repeat protein n=1 Tax=Luteolibacter flavescens TaxID=1859460 RepID=A0ABT3FTM2_9BACT|nr:PQQ-binding-like beta-propeller repeat protein [Luteolibacter flavescens]MCW1886913.1 PQQ-binding-like beta-propeller repeat protein [Luteolibacter flavescens]